LPTPAALAELARRLRLINERVGSTIEGSPIPDLIGRDPDQTPDILRPYQWAQRRACDGFAVTGAFGQLLPAGRIMNALCRPYLGDETPEYTDGQDCPILTMTYYDIDVTAPGRPEGGPYTVDVQRGFELKKSDTAILGFAGGCVYAENPDGTLVPVSCTNFIQFNRHLEVTRYETACAAGSEPSGESGYEPTRPGPPPEPGPTLPDLPGWPGLVIDVGPLRVNVDLQPAIDISIDGDPYDPFVEYPGGQAPEVVKCSEYEIKFDPAIAIAGTNIVSLPVSTVESVCVGVHVTLTRPDDSDGWIAGSTGNRISPRPVSFASLQLKPFGEVARWDTSHQFASQRYTLWGESELVPVAKVELILLPGYSATIIPIRRVKIVEE
jgi:hypothetical protein